ncbi:MAG: hypothetical protein EP323_05690, partial [Gammaproteobacteria bacterium]
MSDSDSNNHEDNLPGQEKRSFLQRIRGQKPDVAESVPTVTQQEPASEPPAAVENEGTSAMTKTRLRDRFRQALSKTSRSLGNLFLGDREIDDELLEELETLLLMADVGIETTVEIIRDLSERVQRRELSHSRALVAALQNAMVEKLKACEQPLVLDT